MLRPHRCSSRTAHFVKPSFVAVTLVCHLLFSTPFSVQARFRVQFAPQQDASAASEKEVHDLPVHQSVQRKLIGGEKHLYRIKLSAGEYLRMRVAQRDINVALTWRDSIGTELKFIDTVGGGTITEELSWQASRGDEYTLEVRARAPQTVKGHYEIRTQKSPAATDEEQTRIAAESSFMEAKRVLQEGVTTKWREAAEKFEDVLPKWRTMKDSRWEATTVHNLGIVYFYLNEYEKAGENWWQASILWRELNYRHGEGGAFTGLGYVSRILSQTEKAREYFAQALIINRETQDKHGEVQVLSNLGDVLKDLNRYAEALEHCSQALIISRQINDRGAEASALDNLGLIYRRLNQPDKAEASFKQSLATWRATNHRYGEANTLHNLGRFYHSIGDNEKAIDFYHQALASRRAIKNRSGEAETLAQLARLKRDRNNLGEARQLIESAVEVVESLRAQITNQNLRAAYFASVQEYFEFYIATLMRLHAQRQDENFTALALQASERARARSLLELLTEAHTDIRRGADLQLLARERALQQQLNKKAAEQTRLLSGKHTAEQAAAASKELDALTIEYNQTEAQIRQSSPRYAALTQPQPLGLREIQAEVLDPETLLLEYALGEERSYVWAVTPDSISSYELPKQSEIEAAARSFYKLLTRRNKSGDAVAGETQVQSSARLAKERAGIDAADAELPKAALQLSEMILSPVAAQLGTKRVVVVADGALQYVPFAALPEPLVDGSNSGQPLIVKHEVVSLPSASTLAVLRREVRGRQSAPGTVAVLADPVFSKEDVRVDKALSRTDKKRSDLGNEDSLAAAPSSTEVVRVLRDANLVRVGTIPRLTSTRREANSILSFAPANQGIKRLDFEANRATATSGDLARYRIVHFATHGVLDSEHPELSGIVLSLVNERGQPIDGFLRLHEIYNLHLPAELVVLSACQTGLGKEIKGEGLIGLTRGFMYAGAKGVAASLWKVEDAATRELMERFYRHLLKENLRPAAALRAAQIEMLNQKRWREPYHWAAFVLQGEWR